MTRSDQTSHSGTHDRAGSSLTERYVHATLREVPEAKRADLGPELRSSIADMVEARIAAGETPETAEYAVLTELGEPGRLAAQYTGARLELLGPRFFLVWKRLTLQLLTWVPALVGTVVAVAQTLQGGHTVGEVVTDTLGAVFGTALQIVFWTTLVFAILDRVVTDESEVVGAWTPERLPDEPVEREYSATDAGLGVAWNLVVAGLLVAQHFRSWVDDPGGGGSDLPLLDPDLWSRWIPVLLAFIALAAAVEVWKYLRGWDLGAVLGTAVSSVGISAVLGWLALEDRLLNPDFVAAVGMEDVWLDRINQAVVVGAVLVALYEVGEAVVRWAKRGRRVTPSSPGPTASPGEATS